ncbi:MAG: hypothetical protein NTX86_05985 [Candidatus Dependentiae bacterium]|nr:hypothetical protein [Candidatus Dependentiae bacterium]
MITSSTFRGLTLAVFFTTCAPVVAFDQCADMRPGSQCLGAEAPWGSLLQSTAGAGTGLLCSLPILRLIADCARENIRTKLVATAASFGLLGSFIGYKWHSNYQHAFDENSGISIYGLAADDDAVGVKTWIAYSSGLSYAVDGNGRNALHFAAANGATKTAELLLASMPMTEQIARGEQHTQTFGHYNGFNGGYGFGNSSSTSTIYEEIKTIDRQDTKFNRTAVLYAALGGHIDVLRVLLLSGANGGLSDNFGNTVASIAATNPAVQKVLDEVQGR